VLSARALIEKDPAYSYVTARLLLHTIRREVLGQEASQSGNEETLRRVLSAVRETRHPGGAPGRAAREFRPEETRLGAGRVARPQVRVPRPARPLYDRYFLHVHGTRIELPQAFFMRVAMGLALNEIDREAARDRVLQVLSSFDFMSSTPTLFNSGTARSQLSSCYLTTVSDDLDGIYEAIKENALLAKYAGASATTGRRYGRWAPISREPTASRRESCPSSRSSTNTAVAVNQGGKRKGAVCSYLETWHLDIEEFLELRKNTGDDRRRTHDMNTANWIPDLFMKRVMENGDWTLFSPSDAPDLHDKHGRAFEKAYLRYEEKVAKGRVEAVQEAPRLAALAQDAVDAVRNRAPVDHFQGSLQSALAASSMRASCTAPICAPRSRSNTTTRKSRCATSGRSTWLRT